MPFSDFLPYDNNIANNYDYENLPSIMFGDDTKEILMKFFK